MCTYLNLEQAKNASAMVWNSSQCKRTPTVHNFEECLPNLPDGMKLSLKLESCQNSGCFKLRGAYVQLSKLKQKLLPNQGVVTYSGGNYGKAFAMMTQELGIPGLVVMPRTAPPSRVEIIEGFGAKVELTEMAELQARVDQHVKEDHMIATHPFDDLDLIAAYCSISFELDDAIPDADVILVPCGGGGLLAGIAAGFRLLGKKDLKIFGVEPETANGMQLSFKIGQPADIPTARSVATGMCAPNAGKLTYPICRETVDDILLVSDEEILHCLKKMASLGFLLEPSGVVALAALMTGKVPLDLQNKKVVAVISGGNVNLQDFQNHVK